jgi:hypothetical protein
MNTELFGSLYFYHLYNFVPVGKYIAKVLREIKHSLTRFSIQLKFIFKISGINSTEETGNSI